MLRRVDYRYGETCSSRLRICRPDVVTNQLLVKKMLYCCTWWEIKSVRNSPSLHTACIPTGITAVRYYHGTRRHNIVFTECWPGDFESSIDNKSSPGDYRTWDKTFFEAGLETLSVNLSMHPNTFTSRDSRGRRRTDDWARYRTPRNEFVAVHPVFATEPTGIS